MAQTLLTLAIAGYLAAFLVCFRHARYARLILAVALVPHVIAVALRWMALGHGPYVGLFDSLSSNLLIQASLFLFIAFFNPAVRAASGPALGLCALFAAWLLFVPDKTVGLPPTYDIWWLYLHLYAGKLAYGLLFVAASIELARGGKSEPQCNGYHFMLAAFFCHSLLLFSGGNWAYVAWGHYWDWNALEVWSLLTWVGFGLYFHARAQSDIPWIPAPRWLVLGTYICAVLTFYGIPFLSKASHQGLV